MANFKDLSLLVLEARKIDNKIIVTKSADDLIDRVKERLNK